MSCEKTLNAEIVGSLFDSPDDNSAIGTSATRIQYYTSLAPDTRKKTEMWNFPDGSSIEMPAVLLPRGVYQLHASVNGGAFSVIKTADLFEVGAFADGMKYIAKLTGATIKEVEQPK